MNRIVKREDLQIAVTLLGRSADLAFVDGNAEHETNCRLLARRLAELLKARHRMGEQEVLAAHRGLVERLGRPPTRDELGVALGVSSRGAYFRAQHRGLELTPQGRKPGAAIAVPS